MKNNVICMNTDRLLHTYSFIGHKHISRPVHEIFGICLRSLSNSFSPSSGNFCHLLITFPNSLDRPKFESLNINFVEQNQQTTKQTC